MTEAASDKETERLTALREYDILGSPAELAYDEIAELAAQVCQCPAAVINLSRRQERLVEMPVWAHAQDADSARIILVRDDGPWIRSPRHSRHDQGRTLCAAS